MENTFNNLHKYIIFYQLVEKRPSEVIIIVINSYRTLLLRWEQQSFNYIEKGYKS